jgi:mannan endo-1,4-beta-mannosidase
MNMKTTSLTILLSITLSANAQTTQEASQLFHRLTELQKKGVMYGHQDDLMYGHAWWYEKDRSDIKEITGDYPAVAGFELGEIETGRDRSLDSVSFVQITEQAKVFHQRNGIITVSWHAVNPITSQYEGAKTANGQGSAWDVRELSANGLNAVKSILPGGENHAMFNHWLDILSDYFHTWKDSNGKLIPFIFRPWHEHSGDFFWWGTTRCTDEEYAALWRYTVTYLRNKGLHNILFAYNTDKVFSREQYMQGYPGDEFIDMLSLDWYGAGNEFNKAVDNALGFISPLAVEKGKLCALSECGNISEDLINIMKKYPLSYFLTWRNTYYEDPAKRKPVGDDSIRELKAMHGNSHTLFLKDIQ